MNLILHNSFDSLDEENNTVKIWQFIDENGNYFCTQTDINSSEDEAKNKFLISLETDSPLGLS
jgi:hypothetical protein